jgi:uncharacterized ParB-like nuclease family protein
VKPKKVQLPLEKIVRIPSLQMRAGGLDAEHAATLAEAVKAGAKLPRVRVRAVEGKGFILTHGFHRFEAHVLADRKTIAADVLSGAWEDCVADAAEANKNQTALPRKRADIRRAVFALLQTPSERGETWANRRIAQHVGVTDKTVAACRLELEARGELDPQAPRVGMDDRAYQTVDEPEERQKTTRKARSPGRVAGFNWSTLENHFGVVVRQLDAAAKALDCGDSAAFKRAEEHAREFVKAVKQLKTREPKKEK